MTLFAHDMPFMAQYMVLWMVTRPSFNYVVRPALMTFFTAGYDDIRHESSPSVREDQDRAEGVWVDVHDHVVPGGLVVGRCGARSLCCTDVLAAGSERPASRR
jgi:hypothetical protein